MIVFHACYRSTSSTVKNVMLQVPIYPKENSRDCKIETCHEKTKKKKQNWHVKQKARSSFHQLQLCNHSCRLHSDPTVVILNHWRYHQSSGIKLQYPTRGSFSTLMITKSYWKVLLPLGEHRSSYCRSPHAACWSQKCMIGVNNLLLPRVE